MTDQTSPAQPAIPVAAPIATPSRRRIDWNQVAELLATGLDPAEIAARLGCDPGRIWRNLRRSRRLRSRVERAAQRRRLMANLRLAHIVEAALLPQPGPGGAAQPVDPALLQWLAQSLGLASVPKDRSGRSYTVMEQFAQAAALPLRNPDQKAASRLRASMAEMDRQFEGIVADLSAGRRLPDAIQRRFGLAEAPPRESPRPESPRSVPNGSE